MLLHGALPLKTSNQLTLVAFNLSVDAYKPGTVTIGAISKTQKAQTFQNCKRGNSLGFLKLQFVAKYEKKIKGGHFGDFKKILKNKQKLRFLNSVTVPKNVKGGPFGIF